jgi:hypothetical protein
MQEIFRRPSKDPLPETPSLPVVGHAALKGIASIVPGLSNALELVLTPPLARRRDDWLKDLETRLRELEDRVDGFHFEELGQNEQFVSATLQATHAALRTHQTEKLEALQNAVMNVAVSMAPPEDLQLIFLNLVDSFTPIHLKILRLFQHPDGTVREGFRRQRDLSDQVVRDLNYRGLINDTRPYAARNRDDSESLVYYQWDVTTLGKQFLEFITSPMNKKT